MLTQLEYLDTQPKASQKKKQPKADEPTKKQPKADEPTRAYSPDQVAGVKRILQVKKSKDLYAILNLEKACSDADIKKAYRRLALQFHPDKCAAPGTDDAFKAIGGAFAVLGDQDKRASYDRFGIDSSESANAPQHTAFRGFDGQEFRGQVSPEELFRMFMGDDFPGFTFQTQMGNNRQPFRRPQFRPQQQQRGGNQTLAQIFQILPLLLLFLFSLLSVFSGSQDYYSLTQTAHYNTPMSTPRHQVRFFINPKTYQKFPQSTRKNLDLSVESDVIFC